MGAYGEHSSRLRNFGGFKLVTNLKETKKAKCKVEYELKKRSMNDLAKKIYNLNTPHARALKKVIIRAFSDRL